jgi:hypothetical protein
MYHLQAGLSATVEYYDMEARCLLTDSSERHLASTPLDTHVEAGSGVSAPANSTRKCFAQQPSYGGGGRPRLRYRDPRYSSAAHAPYGAHPLLAPSGHQTLAPRRLTAQCDWDSWMPARTEHAFPDTPPCQTRRVRTVCILTGRKGCLETLAHRKYRPDAAASATIDLFRAIPVCVRHTLYTV